MRPGIAAAIALAAFLWGCAEPAPPVVYGYVPCPQPPGTASPPPAAAGEAQCVVPLPSLGSPAPR